MDPSDANHLAAVWQDSRQAPAASGDYNVVVSESTDGGATWSDASGGGTVLKGAEGEAYFEPSVAITQAGKIAVSFYRANAYAGSDGMGTYGYGIQVDSGSGFDPYVAVSDSQALASPQSNATQAGFLGDYSSIAASPTTETVYPIWADTRNSTSADPDQDVFLATVTLGD